jgi:hypothetical protein
VRLSKHQLRALRRARHGVTHAYMSSNGNRRRTYDSLFNRGLVRWSNPGTHWLAQATEEGLQVLADEDQEKGPIGARTRGKS